MANIRVDLDCTIKDGTEVVFRSPCDCTEITGLIVYYIAANGSQASKVFALADAHGENVGDIPHLFASDAVVKVILDVTSGMAFVQNADTNAYLEARFAEIEGKYAKKTEIPSVPSKLPNPYALSINGTSYDGSKAVSVSTKQDLSDYAKKSDIPSVPSKLPNPHALTINGKTYDGSSAVSITVEGGSGGGSQADWNAAKGQPGHVLNRTHWVEGGMVEVLAETTLAGTDITTPFELKVGETYTVRFNGVEYTCVCAEQDAGGGVNLPAVTAEPFLLFNVPADMVAEVGMYGLLTPLVELTAAPTLAIYHNAETVHRLDPKFLPDGVGESPIMVVSLKGFDESTGMPVVSHTAGEIVNALMNGKIVFMLVEGVFVATGNWTEGGGEIETAEFAYLFDPTMVVGVDANGTLVMEG